MENFCHPELRKGEIFFCNVRDWKDFCEIVLKTKRLGGVAYSESGKDLAELSGDRLFPVFIQEEEVMGFSFDCSMPDHYPSEVKVFEIMFLNGETEKAAIDFSKQYSFEGKQWAPLSSNKVLDKSKILGWREVKL